MFPLWKWMLIVDALLSTTTSWLLRLSLFRCAFAAILKSRHPSHWQMPINQSTRLHRVRWRCHSLSTWHFLLVESLPQLCTIDGDGSSGTFLVIVHVSTVEADAHCGQPFLLVFFLALAVGISSVVHH
mmetsp:Transcript_16292/g.26751  ORF Transcript_16292/g.26751 Transcript_16292/m.26751 type:complete len:128 (-) Transcript_16292:107-490(-)